MSLRKVALNVPTIYKVRVSSMVSSVANSTTAGASKALLQLLRIDPSTNTKRIDTYEYVKNQDFMVLDLLTAIKAHQDPSLAFRASCCEGVCGSCGMNINGINSLACVTFAQGVTTVGPLPNFPVIKDLVVDLRGFFKQYEFIRPYTRNINLPRYHSASITHRYTSMCEAMYGKPLPVPVNQHALTITQQYALLADTLVNKGYYKEVAYILHTLREKGYTISNQLAKELITKAIENSRGQAK